MEIEYVTICFKHKLTLMGICVYVFPSKQVVTVVKTFSHVLSFFQLVPYFLMEVMGEYHGIPGLFLAAVFAAALRCVYGLLFIVYYFNTKASIFLAQCEIPR